ncbi:alpha-tocopherol transfer protein-like [Teleopsis dalmanni]|uniref:alpha-tocopherol transfer protein-like n=1 Tax=Teleopsis dalmanni TaxID=139649 RepID=UPI0018CE2CD2|nr:alpha-tocopherol transfer protein-like [Teleopsis dalmanni]XP_037943785.1 alpha-tocopherol transfer protein-like [Teleopsis dalmanni]
MRPLTPALAKIAKEELNETPERVEQDLFILRVWIRQQIHLRARTSDEFLIAFLRRCNFSLEETKKRIELFFHFYNLMPEIFYNRLVTERLLNMNKTGIYFYPEYPKCDNQSALLIIRIGQFSWKWHTQRELVRFVTMAMEIIALENDNASVAGVTEIIDLDDCLPLRIKDIFVINPSKEVLRMFLFQQFLQRASNYPIIVLKTTEELYKHVPRKCLPEEYGGYNGHIAECVGYMEDSLRSYKSYFEEDSLYGVNESLRRGEVPLYEAEFGLAGTFRKFKID